MKICARIVLTLFISFIALFVMGVSTQNGVEIFPNLSVISTPGTGEENYFATVGATGTTCLSWATACTFRTAVGKCSGTKQCNVFLGAGIHDTNNGSDANGTTISVDYVRLIGFGEPDEIGQSSQIANKRLGGAGVVDYVLQVTGGRFSIEHVAFDQSAQSDKTATHLRLRGSYNTVHECVFRQATADGANTGILMDNTSVSHTIEGCRFRRLEGYGLNMGDASRFYVNNNIFMNDTTGIYASSANADNGVFRSNSYIGCTTAVNLTTAQAKTWYSISAAYSSNTTNFADLTAYGGTIFMINPIFSNIGRTMYPAGSAGGAAGTGCVSITKDADTWTWGNIIEIIPINTINKPFRIAAVSPQSWNAAQVFRLELYYGSASPGNISLGQYEFVLGDTVAARVNSQPVAVARLIPARAAVGARIMSSTGGADNVCVSVAYEPVN